MKKVIRYWHLIIPAVLLLAFSQIPSNRYFAITKSLELYSEVFKEVNDYYVDDINPNQLMETGLSEMLSTLDPYTSYIPYERREQAATYQGEQYAGIGTTIIYKDGNTIVDLVPENSEAMLRGLETGDYILSVDDIPITEMDPEEVNLLIMGQANTFVKLIVKKYATEEVMEINLPRKKLQRKSVPTHLMLPGEIGYVKLNIFNGGAGREVKVAVSELIENNAKGIILDLRGNGGGLLNEAINIVNIFVPRDKEVVTTRGKIIENNATYKTLSAPTNTDIPLIVLVNSTSASASEIVAGTIQDYDRGVIMGTKSFGKGLVQVFLPLSYNSELKVTSAKYYTPSGRCIQALDYSNRRNDGSVGKIPDSLKQVFYTENGREVYDGGGVDPDVAFIDESAPPLLRALTNELMIFNFANKFANENETIPEPREFKIEDKTLNEFINWTLATDFKYETILEQEILELKSLAEEEKYIDYIQDNIASLGKELDRSKKNDLMKYKEDIRFELQQEITKRYYYERGIVESTLDNDAWIEAAIKLIKDEKQYNSILGN